MAHEAARQSQLLPLCEGGLDSLAPGAAELGLQALGQPLDDLGGATSGNGGLDRRGELLAWLVPETDGSPDPELEAHEVLERTTDARAPVGSRDPREVDTVDEHAPLAGQIGRAHV